MKNSANQSLKNDKPPSEWRMVRFDDLAQHINERVDPSDTEAEVYVGLEHLDSDTFKIRRWGTPDDVIGDKLRFQKGDIIFGKRRAYQRKLGVAECDGICSAHAMVLRAKEDVVDAKFLAFLLQSDSFMKRAVEISVGSLSPTINWTTLRTQEFSVPPMKKQRRIAEILRAVDDVTESWMIAASELNSLRATLLLSSFPHGIDGLKNGDLLTGWQTCCLGEAVEVKSGGTPSRQKPEYWKGPLPWVKTGEINYTDIKSTEESITRLGMDNSSAKIVPAGTVVLALFGQGPTLGRVGRLMIDATVNQACAALLPSHNIDQDYLYFYLIREYSSIRRLARGASQPNLNLSIVRNLRLPLCDMALQREISGRLRQVEETKTWLTEHLDAVRRLFAQLTNNLVTGVVDVH